MGWTIDAYYPADQNEIEQFIKENNIDIADWKQCKIISKHFYEKIYISGIDRSFSSFNYRITMGSL